jgi:hypothetical protein
MRKQLNGTTGQTARLNGRSAGGRPQMGPDEVNPFHREVKGHTISSGCILYRWAGFLVEEGMKKLSLVVGLLALLGTTAMAQQTTQSRPTSQAGVRGSTFTSGMTSRNSGSMTSSDSTTGMIAGSERGSLNGSPATAPKATTGPNGQPSNNETPPK